MSLLVHNQHMRIFQNLHRTVSPIAPWGSFSTPSLYVVWQEKPSPTLWQISTVVSRQRHSSPLLLIRCQPREVLAIRTTTTAFGTTKCGVESQKILWNSFQRPFLIVRSFPPWIRFPCWRSIFIHIHHLPSFPHQIHLQFSCIPLFLIFLSFKNKEKIT